MPRKLIIAILVLLIIGVIGGTAVLLMRRFGKGTSEETPSPSGLPSSGERATEVVNPTADDDNDGLNNGEEAVWGTDPKNADTDGDNYKDGEEIKANHNPTIAGPNDALPEGFDPRRSLQPPPQAPLSVDQYFENNVELAPKENLTRAYDRQYKDDQKSEATLMQFVQVQPLVVKLPTVKQNAIKFTNDSSRTAMLNELSAVGTLSALNNKSLLTDGLADLLEKGDASIMRAMAMDVRSYQDRLLSTPVPPQAEQLHRLLLGYTELLAATFDQIADWDNDQVRALVAIRQLDAIDRQYYPLIQQEVQRLRATSAAGGL